MSDCKTCAHQSDSGNEYCGCCGDGPGYSNYAEAAWHVEERLKATIAQQQQRIAAAERVVVAMRQVAKGEGRFSIDPLEHASNTIEDMKGLARRDLGDDAAREVRDGGG